MAKVRTYLAGRRSLFAHYRALLAKSRTGLAFIRTGLSCVTIALLFLRLIGYTRQLDARLYSDEMVDTLAKRFLQGDYRIAP